MKLSTTLVSMKVDQLMLGSWETKRDLLTIRKEDNKTLIRLLFLQRVSSKPFFMQKRTSKKERSFTLIMMLEDKSQQTSLENMILSKSQKNDDLN